MNTPNTPKCARLVRRINNYKLLYVKSVLIMAFHVNTNLFFKYDSLQPSHFLFLQETYGLSLGTHTHQRV